MRAIAFPRDELPHQCSLEWWYLNGHLKDAKGKSYAFMNCLFGFNTKILRNHVPLMPAAHVHFSHEMLCDLTRKKTTIDMDHLSGIARQAKKSPLLNIAYQPWTSITSRQQRVIEEDKPFEYHLRTDKLDLRFISRKPPLLVGGKGYVDLGSRKAYYYSLTNLATTGTIRVGKRTVKVHGISWMDHQWMNIKHLKGGWTWFSIQLENNTQLVCWRYESKGRTTCGSSISHPDGTSTHHKDIRFTPRGTSWISPHTGIAYQTAWDITLPSISITLHATPVLEDQEMRFHTPNYWEGPMMIRGTINGKRTRGKGFLEIIGKRKP